MIILKKHPFFSFSIKLFFCIALTVFQFNILFAQKQKNELDAIIKEWASPDDFPDHVILSATKDPSTSIGINWRTKSSNKVGYVEIAVAGDGPNFRKKKIRQYAKRSLVNSEKATIDGFESSFFEVKIEGLKPKTLYAYRVGNTKFKSEWHQFTTASDKESPISFLYVGDAQNYILELWSRVIRNAFKEAPNADFFIHAGDLVNLAHDESEWNEWFAAGSFIHSQIPSIAVPGNHEYQGADKNQPRAGRELSIQWESQFSFPKNGPKGLEETCYYIDYPNLKVIALNSNVKIKLQANWLKKVLATNNKKWTVVTYHHPVFSASTGRDNAELRKYWKPLFDEYNVDLALQGHDHTYARGAVFKNPNQLERDGKSKIVKGPVYVVSVSGGKMYSLSKQGWDEFGAKREKAGEQIQLFQHISIDGNLLKYKSFTPTGRLFDSFQILKDGDQNKLNNHF